MQKIIQTSQAPQPIGPYSQAVQAGNFLYVSGQIPLHPTSGELIVGDINKETHQVMENLKAVLIEAGFTFNQVVKATILLSDMAHFDIVNRIYGSYFTTHFPARETYAVKTLPKSVNVEISVIAYA